MITTLGITPHATTQNLQDTVRIYLAVSTNLFNVSSGVIHRVASRPYAHVYAGSQEGTIADYIYLDQVSGETEPAETHAPTTPAPTRMEIILSSDSDPPTRPQRRTSRLRTLSSHPIDPSAPAEPAGDSIDDTYKSVSEASTAMDVDSDEDIAELAESPELPMRTKKRCPSLMLGGNDDTLPLNKRTRSKGVASLATPKAAVESPPARNTRSSNRTASTAQAKLIAPVTRSHTQATSEVLTMLTKRGGEKLQVTPASATPTRKENLDSDGDAALETSTPINLCRLKATTPTINMAVEKRATKGLQNASAEAGTSAPETKSSSAIRKEVKPVCEARVGCHIAYAHYFHCTDPGCDRIERHRPHRDSGYKHALATTFQQATIIPSSPPPPRSASSSPIDSPPSSPEPPQTVEVIGAAGRRMMNASRFLAQTSKSISTPFDYATIEPREVKDGVRRLKRTLGLWEIVSKQVMTAFEETIGEIEKLGKQKGKAA